MIKYLGSKRTLVPVLGTIATAAEARTAVDLFTGTTRVAQEFKRRGVHVHANDLATYALVLAQCFIATDAEAIDLATLTAAVTELNQVPGKPGYVARTFGEEARFIHPTNGARIDAIRDAIEERYAGTWVYPLLLTSLLLAADRVESTTGVQMAYLKDWAPRALNPLELRIPHLIPGAGVASCSDARTLAEQLPATDLMYLDPPYNQHRYFTNYHVWETLIRWDAPEAYGVARKRIDARAATSRSRYNSKREMPDELRRLLQTVTAQLVVVSYNNEAWVEPAQMMQDLRACGFPDVRLLAFDEMQIT
ncbi:MAG: DNA adenine methylase, partial [Parahaliea sp.]